MNSLKAKDKKGKILGKLLALDIERIARCGNGDGKTYSHSTNCNCERIDLEEVILKEELKKAKEHGVEIPDVPTKYSLKK